MGVISIQNVMKQFGDRVVLDNVSLELTSGEIVGLVGPNGAGKTTLFRLVMGQIKPDAGTVTRSRGFDVGYLSQDPEIRLENTLHDEALSAFEGVLALERRMHELSHRMATAGGEELSALMAQYDRVNSEFIAAGGYKFEQELDEILGGLGFAEQEYGLPMSALSGGQKCRAALAKLLLQDSAYLLLDEPTNHLDIDAVRWLERFLKGHHGGAAIISHDRYLLDRVADRIIEVEGGGARSYPGNYTNYVKTRELRRLTQEREFENDRAFIEKERDFIARHLAGQRSNEAKGRRTRLERRLAAGEFVTERPTDRRTLKFDMETEPLTGRTVFEATELSKSYGDKRLFSEFNVSINAGERVGVTGPNGAGKSTLLKILLKQIAPDSGAARIDGKATIGYYAQEALAERSETPILSDLQASFPHLNEQRARDLLAAFLFTGADVFKPLNRLSGGEHSRVRLLKLMLASPNVLVLDEPTNHLDIPSREALENALDDYEGTILVVSHDRYFLDRIVTRLLVLRDGVFTSHRGGYSEYIEKLEATASKPQKAPPADRSVKTPAKPVAQKPKKPKSRFDKLSLEELETLIFSCETRIKGFDARFADPRVNRDPDALARLRQEYDAARQELAEAEAAWTARAEG